VQVGIRSLSKEEYDWITPNPAVTTFYAWKTLPDLSKHFDEIVAALPEHVYITVDMDAFDPSVAPGVGTPEPGGLMYHDVVGLIRQVAKHRTIVGADINEVRPIEDQVQTEFTAARLAYKIIGLVSKQNKWFDAIPEGGLIPEHQTSRRPSQGSSSVH
jgi:agmatinase